VEPNHEETAKLKPTRDARAEAQDVFLEVENVARLEAKRYAESERALKKVEPYQEEIAKREPTRDARVKARDVFLREENVARLEAKRYADVQRK
jgi:hypothetical protein